MSAGYGMSAKVAATLRAVKDRFGKDKPMVVDSANTVIYGDVAGARASGRKRVAVYRCALSATDDAARELREALIEAYGPDR